MRIFFSFPLFGERRPGPSYDNMMCLSRCACVITSNSPIHGRVISLCAVCADWPKSVERSAVNPKALFPNDFFSTPRHFRQTLEVPIN